MFNIGPLEFTLVFVVALIIFGPQKLPEVARFLGKAAREVQKLSSGAYSMWNEAMREQPAPPENKPQDNDSFKQTADQKEGREGSGLSDEEEKPRQEA